MIPEEALPMVFTKLDGFVKSRHSGENWRPVNL